MQEGLGAPLGERRRGVVEVAEDLADRRRLALGEEGRAGALGVGVGLLGELGRARLGEGDEHRVDGAHPVVAEGRPALVLRDPALLAEAIEAPADLLDQVLKGPLRGDRVGGVAVEAEGLVAVELRVLAALDLAVEEAGRGDREEALPLRTAPPGAGVAGLADEGRLLGTSWRYGETAAVETWGPDVDLYVMDADNYALFAAGEPFEAVAAGEGEVDVDPKAAWVVVVANQRVSATAAYGTLSATVTPGGNASFVDSASAELRYRLLPGQHAALRMTP